jgi:16S rRNA (cytidine1402-2'-O)-methyltransferase
LPESVAKTIEMIDYYIVENEKTARRHIKKILPEKKQPELKIRLLNKHTDNKEFSEMLQPCLDGINVGLMSEAGCPAIADPGAAIVKIAHQKGIQVVPMVGPSSILMAMMGSGFNGQSFAFNGYLPIEKSDKKSALKHFERLSIEKNQSQIFIETPYRNNKLFEDLLQILQPHTLLCIAADITLETEFIQTKKVSDWKKTKVDLHNRPCIFILSKD